MRKLRDKTLLRAEVLERKAGDRLTTLCIKQDGFWDFSPHYSKEYHPKNSTIVDTKGWSRRKLNLFIKDWEERT